MLSNIRYISAGYISPRVIPAIGVRSYGELLGSAQIGKRLSHAAIGLDLDTRTVLVSMLVIGDEDEESVAYARAAIRSASHAVDRWERGTATLWSDSLINVELPDDNLVILKAHEFTVHD